MTVDACYLVNCEKNGDQRSAVPYYKQVKLGGGNDNTQPDAFVYTSFGSFKRWEGSQQSMAPPRTSISISNKGLIDATFHDTDVKFTWNIRGTLESNRNLSTGTNVGEAGNGFESRANFKDNGNYMFSNGDGYDCKKVYFCN